MVEDNGYDQSIALYAGLQCLKVFNEISIL